MGAEELHHKVTKNLPRREVAAFLTELCGAEGELQSRELSLHFAF